MLISILLLMLHLMVTIDAKPTIKNLFKNIRKTIQSIEAMPRDELLVFLERQYGSVKGHACEKYLDPVPTTPNDANECVLDMIRINEIKYAKAFRFYFGGSAEVKDSEGYAPLSRAIIAGDGDFVARLLEFGVNPNRGKKDLLKPILLAVKSGRLDIVDSLVRNGASVGPTQWPKRAPIDEFLDKWTTAKKPDNGVKEIISQIRHVTNIAWMQNSYLENYLKNYQSLIIDGTYHYGFTSLMTAVREGLKSHVTALLKRGASIDRVDRFGLTSLYWALDGLQQRMWNLLLKHGERDGRNPVRIVNVLVRAIRRSDSNVKEKILSLKPLFLDLHDDLDGETPLIAAIRADDTGTVIDLINDHGVSVNLNSRYGISPLMHAIQLKRYQAVYSILPKVDDINAEDRAGFSALKYALVNYAGEEDKSMALLLIQSLVKAGADKAKVCLDKKSALDLAQELGLSEKVLRIL